MGENFNKKLSGNPSYPNIKKCRNSRQGLIRYELSSIAIKDEYPGEIYEDDYEQFDIFEQKSNYNKIENYFGSALALYYNRF